MQAFTSVSGIAAALPLANVDTDVIMPKQFLKGITRDGLAEGVFHDLRLDASGNPRPDFILNRPGYAAVRFLIVGPNFGCGSSREHAVWGLQQLGIRALIGSTFASIFHDNCFKNGLLPVSLPIDAVEGIRSHCSSPARSTLRIDLPGQVIQLDDGRRVGFQIDALRKEDLIEGRDSIQTTLTAIADINDFERRHWATWPWIEPGRNTP